MAPTATSKRKRPSFSPPRPKSKKATSSKAHSKGATKVGAKKKQVSSKSASATTSRESTPDEESANGSGRSPSPDYMLAEIETHPGPNNSSAEPIVSLDLIHRLLNYHFHDKEKTKITTDAREVVGKYIETFVREAIARSAFEREEADKEEKGDKGFLEVDDLEKMAPQLVMDF